MTLTNTSPLHRLDAWTVAETDYAPELNAYYETVFSLANGYLGVRGTPEEGCSGEHCSPGSYLAGVYAQYDAPHEWPRTGFAVKCDRMVQTLDWIGLSFTIAGHPFDPAQCTVTDYARVLDLRRGLLTRTLTVTDAGGYTTRFDFTRFVSQARPAIGVVRCTVTPIGHQAEIQLFANLRGRNGTDTEWEADDAYALSRDGALLLEQVPTSDIRVAGAMRVRVDEAETYVYCIMHNEVIVEAQLPVGRSCTIDKIVAIRTSRDPGAEEAPEQRAVTELDAAAAAGFDALLAEHLAAWERIWEERDVRIEGDTAAQQGIRFSIFQMEQAYSGRDDTLNIGPRALSVLDHNGQYFWDTEAYMVPYYCWQAPDKARALLIQRYRTLPQAMARAEQHGYRGAMFPWSTIDGTESALPWEYAELQAHVSADIPYAVWHYVAATGDHEFLLRYGADLLVQGCRFWADRSFFAADGSCRINCVTGPDEYTIAVDNDHYTNAIVRFVFRQAVALLELLQREYPADYAQLIDRLGLRPDEMSDWLQRADAMRLPLLAKRGIFPQHETFMEMEPMDLRDFPAQWRPAWGRCPWERIIRLQIIKQPDVLLAMHLLAEEYTPKQLRANFDFYDPKTIHESSLGACIHAIIASAIGREEEAFAFYLRGARLDLDERWTRGIRIANAAGAWQVLVNGFAGMRLSTRDQTLSFAPRLPKDWTALAFSLHFQGRHLRVRIDRRAISIDNDGVPLTVRVGRRSVQVEGHVSVPLTAPHARKR